MPAKTIGLISDTHGLLRPEAMAALRGSDFIIHAGDIGDPKILDALRQIAPVTAIRGNNDMGDWASGLKDTEVLQIGETRIYVIHNLAELDINPAATGIHVIVSGHSHKPEYRETDGIHYINPGSAGPRRFTLPIAVGRLHIVSDRVTAELVELSIRSS
jgi:putative phosphoesterase